MKKIIYIITFLFAATQYSYGASLKEVLDVALEKDPLLSSARYKSYATRGDKTEACGKLFPQLSVDSAYIDYNQDKAGSVLGSGTANTNGVIDGSQTSIGLTLNQTLLDLNKLADCKMWRASVSRDDAGYEIAMEELIYRVVLSYLNVLSAQSDLSSANSEVRLYRELKKEKEHAFERRVISQREFFSVSAKHDNAVANKQKAANDFITAKERLKNLYDTDIPNEKLLVIKDGVVLSLVEEASPEHWADVAEQSNLGLIRSELSEEVYKYGMKMEQSRFLPTVDAFANHTDYDSDFDRNGTLDNGNFSTETIGVRLNWKLFSGGSDYGRVRAAKNRYLSAQQEAAAQRDMVRIDAKNSSRGLIVLKSKIEASTTLLEAARLEFEAVKKGSESKTKTKSDLLEATLNYLDARTQLNKARYDYVVGVMDFWRSIGSLSVQSVEQIDSLFIAPKDDIIRMSGVFESKTGFKQSGQNEDILMELLKSFGNRINDFMI